MMEKQFMGFEADLEEACRPSDPLKPPQLISFNGFLHWPVMASPTNNTGLGMEPKRPSPPARQVDQVDRAPIGP